MRSLRYPVTRFREMTDDEIECESQSFDDETGVSLEPSNSMWVCFVRTPRIGDVSPHPEASVLRVLRGAGGGAACRRVGRVARGELVPARRGR